VVIGNGGSEVAILLDGGNGVVMLAEVEILVGRGTMVWIVEPSDVSSVATGTTVNTKVPLEVSTVVTAGTIVLIAEPLEIITVDTFVIMGTTVLLDVVVEASEIVRVTESSVVMAVGNTGTTV